MPRVNTVGLTELANDLKKEMGTSRERIEEMLEYGAEKIAENTQAAAEKHGLRRTGQMIKSIKPGPVQIFSDSVQVEIWPQGTRKNGKKRGRNATVGFVQHYGRGYGSGRVRPGTHFFDEGEAAVADVVTEGMAKIWSKGENT